MISVDLFCTSYRKAEGSKVDYPYDEAKNQYPELMRSGLLGDLLVIENAFIFDSESSEPN